jgi:hypothetical protein
MRTVCKGERIGAAAATVFDYLDDPARFGEHMGRGNWRTAGMRMRYVLDATRGQAVGSLIRMEGLMYGLKLRVDQVGACPTLAALDRRDVCAVVCCSGPQQCDRSVRPTRGRLRKRKIKHAKA